jgi:hypothetical protein
MPADQDKSPPAKAPEARSKGRLLDWLDAIAKLVGAGAILLGALIANSFQSKLGGVSIQTQREQAESQLRANMFSSLINPLAGPQSGGKAISPDREELLAELLALNFYENFELKPLLEDASQRLVTETNQKQGVGATDPREPLWSVSRRIAERQRASIAWEWGANRSGHPAGQLGVCQFYTVIVVPPQEKEEEQKDEKEKEECQFSGAFGTFFDLKSPDQNYTLNMTLTKPDWKNQTVNISAWPYVTKNGKQPADVSYNFRLSWFDLPFTDNTLLPDGNRFAIYLRLLQPPYAATAAQPAYPGRLTIVVMWFPKGYFTPRERPLNYREVQKLLGGK